MIQRLLTESGKLIVRAELSSLTATMTRLYPTSVKNAVARWSNRRFRKDPQLEWRREWVIAQCHSTECEIGVL